MNTYRRALSTPGAVRFVMAAFVGRLPISMVGLGTLLLVNHRTGSYGLAGAVAAVGALTEGIAAPRIGRLLDRIGQAPVLLGCLVMHVSAVAGLLVAVRTDSPRPWWFAASACVGGFMPPIGACVRARWSAQLSGSPLLAAAFALESAIDELVFILGPTLVTSLAVAVSPTAGLATSACFAVVGTLALVGQRSTDPGPRMGDVRPRAGMLRNAGTRMLVVTFLATGAAFGALDVSMVAFGRAEGFAAASGGMLGLVAAGSGAAGLFYGARRHVRPPGRRLVTSAAIFSLGMCLPLVAPTVPVMLPVAVAAGATVAPFLINGYALIQELMPPGTLTEGFAWLTTAIALGVAAGSPVAGHVIDLHGPRAGFAVVAACALVAAAVAVSGRHALGPRPSDRPAVRSGAVAPERS